MTELFCKNSKRLKVISYFCKNADTIGFWLGDWVFKYVSQQYCQKIRHLKNVVTERNKRFKPWSIRSLHSHFLNILLIRVKTFMTSIGRGGEEVLKFVTCLYILLFLNSRSIVHFCGWGCVGVGGGVVCGRHNCMIFNIKVCFDKKVTLLTLVPVL